MPSSPSREMQSDSCVIGPSSSGRLYSGTRTKSESAANKPARPQFILMVQTQEEADKLWAWMKRPLWQEDPVLQTKIGTKGNYNCSSHLDNFVSLLTGRSPKAFQSLQNEIGCNPSLLLSSSGLNRLHLRLRQTGGNGTSEPQGSTHLKVNYV